MMAAHGGRQLGANGNVPGDGCPDESDNVTACGRSEERVSSRWIRGSVLGQGSFGRVHYALDRRSCAVFAVKTVVISPAAVCNPGGSLARAPMAELRGLENEITILGRLGPSPHVVRYLGDDWTVAQDGSMERNLFLELANGGSLADFTKRFGGKLDESMIRRCCRGMVRGLQHAHSRGVVHRDVKGQNVLTMVDEAGGVTAKLADFGASACIWGNRGADNDGQSQGSSGDECGACPRRSAGLAGTVQWMAPEVACQSGPLTVASDIWSLGCTVIEMATGRAPWSDVEDIMSALFRIACTDEVPAFPEHLSVEAKDFLSKCLVREPSRRWSASQLLEHPFLANAGHEAVAPARRRSSSAKLVEGNSHPVGLRAHVDRALAEGAVSYPLGGGKEAPMGDDMRESGETRWGSGSERLTCSSRLEKARKQEVSPRLVFDLPTAFGSEVSIHSANGAGLVAVPIRKNGQSSAPDVSLDGLGWECNHGDGKRLGLTGLIQSCSIEREDGKAPVEGHPGRPNDAPRAEEALPVKPDAFCRIQKPLPDGCSPGCSLVHRSSRREIFRGFDEESDAGGEEAAVMNKADVGLWQPASRELSVRGPSGEWIQVLRGRRQQGCRVASPSKESASAGERRWSWMRCAIHHRDDVSPPQQQVTSGRIASIGSTPGHPERCISRLDDLRILVTDAQNRWYVKQRASISMTSNNVGSTKRVDLRAEE
ncbi:hypothetical protein CBR_g36775 [Chara braunii]|uniref:Protein kinase domain-containing protein n=1 Tax=Chara braunii TaxID=69332 RepID=A0A388LLG2_CHABU|nr:hypothetical protein CBR_g36775 [Chara braunii]|eukprot:GBG83159.1 hypothetical protein CBR_g36775 [Chara braunii]